MSNDSWIFFVQKATSAVEVALVEGYSDTTCQCNDLSDVFDDIVSIVVCFVEENDKVVVVSETLVYRVVLVMADRTRINVRLDALLV